MQHRRKIAKFVPNNKKPSLNHGREKGIKKRNL